jgi:hypothetical protein
MDMKKYKCRLYRKVTAYEKKLSRIQGTQL